MSFVANKLKSLRKSIVGNREITEFEYTFGLTVEEQNHITALNPWQRRIVSELEFAYHLSKVNGGSYDIQIIQAIDLLADAIAKQGVLTNEDAKRAEEMLLTLQQSAKEYDIILAAHAHIDMNWMWSWHETVAATLDTFRTMLTIMDEYPDFCFSQSQAAVYKIVEDFDPDMMEQIKMRIKEGRWEVTASTWVENDKNMPTTESLMRHNYYTKKYLYENWGIDPKSLKIDFSPDTFGHSANMPEIMKNGEVDYCYHCRGYKGDNILYCWRAPSGAEVLVHREPYWYNSAITPHIGIGLIDIAEKCAGLKTGLIVYGVGNHGGGPTRRDIERAIEMQNWPIFPTIQFGTLGAYFQKAEAVREKLKVVNHELNHIFTGCYTTQSRIKYGNKKSESALFDAEGINALASSFVGAKYPHGQYARAWQGVLFNHFHDILTGSCVQDSREHAMGLYSEALAVANTARSNAMRAIAAKIDTSKYQDDMVDASSQSEGAGAGYGSAYGVSLPERGNGMLRIFHVFNPSPYKRQEIVELTVWDWHFDIKRLSYKDSNDQVISYQVLDEKPLKYWDHQYFRVLVEVVLPPYGYETVVMNQESLKEYPVHFNQENLKKFEIYENYLLENELIKAEFDYVSGNLISLIDKVTGIEQIKEGDSGGFRIIQSEGSISSAWVIGRYTSVDSINKCNKMRYTKGELRTSLEMEIPMLNSLAKVTVSLDKGQSVIRYSAEIDWKEASTDGTTAPLLSFMLPTAFKADGYAYDIPGGYIYREALNHDIPALQYSAVFCGDRALALTSDCKYGYRNTQEGISLSVIHTPNRPDPYPERGVHQIKFGIIVGNASAKKLHEAAFDFSHMPVYVSVNPHKGEWPLSQSLLHISSNGAIITGIKKAEQGEGLILHLVNTLSEETEAVLTFLNEIKNAEENNSLEQPTGAKFQAKDNMLTLKMAPNQLMAVRASF